MPLDRWRKLLLAFSIWAFHHHMQHQSSAVQLLWATLMKKRKLFSSTRSFAPRGVLRSLIDGEDRMGATIKTPQKILRPNFGALKISDSVK